MRLQPPPSVRSTLGLWAAVAVALVLLLALYWASTNRPLLAAATGIALVLGVPVLLLWSQLQQSHAQADAQRERTQLLLQSALGTASTGSWRIDLRGPQHTVQLSAEARRIYGYAPQTPIDLAQWLQHAARTGDAGPATESPEQLLQRLLHGDATSLDCTYAHVRPVDGQTVWLRDRGLLRHDAAGRSVELVGVVVDVTDLHHTEEERYRSSTALMQAMESTQSGTWSVDYVAAPQTMSLSERTQRILGLAPAPGNLYNVEDIRQHRAAANHPECVTEALLAYEAVHQGHTDIYSVVSAWRRPDTGAVIWTHTTGKVKRDATGKLLNMVGLMRDVTHEKTYQLELLQAKHAAESASRAKGDFLANMSHEILTPLNAIIGLSGLAIHGVVEPRQQDYLKKIRNASQHLLGVLNGILDFAQAEAGELEIQPEMFDISDLIDSVIRAVGEKADHQGLELVCSMDPALPRTLVGDPLRIGQILTNFANNAVKFTEAGDIHLQVAVTESAPGQVHLRFAITDTGIGITQDQLGRLFKSFTQADTSITRRYGGTGMGLAISQKLAHAMGGRLGVESHFGTGSTFTLEVQLGVGSAAKLATLPSIDLHGRTALVVDDNALASTVLCESLAELGFAVQSSPAAQPALQHIKTAQDLGRPFDLVLIDLSMPGLDEWSIPRSLRAMQIDTASVVLMAPAHRCAALQADAERLGLRHILPKPVTLGPLSQVLLQVFTPEVSAGPTPQADTHQRLQHIRGARVLLVEDNEINQQLACELLQDAGFAVDVAANGTIGVDKVHARQALHQPYDLVLMDIQMPVMDGITATRLLRGRFGPNTLPIVAMTANGSLADRERYKAVGMNDFVAKPVDPQQLWRALLACVAPRAGLGAAPALVPMPTVAVPDSPPHDDGDDTSRLMDALGSVDGLDVVLGLARTNHKPSFYLKILRKFAVSQALAMTQIEQAVQAQDTARAERLAHTLKGLAGTLGASALQAVAADLESYLRNQAKASLTAHAMASTRTMLDGMLNALHAIPGLIITQEPVTATALSDAERHQAEACLQHIKQLLAHSNADVLDHWQAHAPQLRALVGQAAQVEEAINGFDFDLALELLGADQPATA